NSNRVQTGERGEVPRCDDNDYGQPDRDEEGNLGHTMPVECHELRWHFLIACHHVKQTDHRDDGSVGCAQEKEEKDNANNPTKHFSESRTKTGASKISANKAQHIFTAELQCLANRI